MDVSEQLRREVNALGLSLGTRLSSLERQLETNGRADGTLAAKLNKRLDDLEARLEKQSAPPETPASQWPRPAWFWTIARIAVLVGASGGSFTAGWKVGWCEAEWGRLEVEQAQVEGLP